MPKRLFLFAGYDPHGIIDQSLVMYVRALAEFGDVILVMDSDCDESQLCKVRPYVLYAAAVRHGEYDFGSYRHAYEYAREQNILNNYDYLYIVNDSVYGPLHNMASQIQQMESSPFDEFGIVLNPKKTHPHIQSWFVGFRRNIFLTKWFDEFMLSITRQPSKGAITRKYEQGLTRIIMEHGLSYGALYTIPGRGVYNKIKKLYKKGLPLMKKVAFSRRNGALGGQVLYVLNHISPDARTAILENANRIWGEKYIHWLLTKNPAKIIYRNIAYMLRKIFIEGI